jgi:DNA polymerase-1
MPDDLAAQIPPLYECIRAMGWPMLIVEGVEADDVIGTLAKQAEPENIRCIISTGDKDIAQLVNSRVTLVNTMTNEVLDEAGVLARFGVPPARMLDYLALVGDATDNIPGVEKVGPKTAVKWLGQYGTLDNLIAHAGEIGGVVGENLRKALDWLSKSPGLLAIKCDVILPVGVHDLGLQPQNAAKLAELYERLDFKTWLRELRQQSLIGEESEQGEHARSLFAAGYRKDADEVQVDYETIFTQSQLEDWMARLSAAPLVSLDTETTSLDPMQAQLIGIAFSVEPHRAAYVPLAHRYAGAPPQLAIDFVLDKLKPWLQDPASFKVGQNLKYDKHVFANHGIALNGIVHDTLLQSYVLEPHRPHDMDSLALRHLDVRTISYNDVTGKGASRISFDQVDIERATQYAAEDADITLRLHQNLYPLIACDSKLDHVYRVLEMPVMEILFEMERDGVLLDLKLLETQSRELAEKMLVLEDRACTIAGQPFNLNSTKQIQEVLFNQLKLPVLKKTPGGTASTDEDVLQRLAPDYPLAKALLDYRGLAKLKSTYTDKLPRMVDATTGRVHTNYAQAVAVTGRLASNEPNLQNIPVRTAEGRRIREAFIASPGHSIVSADYSQIELRIMAHISRDSGLLRAFGAGEDIHRATAAEIFGMPPEEIGHEQRRYAKIINFGLIYGMSEFGLASQLGIERAAARAYIDRYFARYPGVANYMQRTRETARQAGFVETVFGRRLWLPEINSSNANRRQASERAAINAPMQGTAADIIKLAMIAVHGWLAHENLLSKVIMQVHDELVLEVPDHEIEKMKSELPLLMGAVTKLDVPLLVEVGVGPNWEKAH